LTYDGNNTHRYDADSCICAAKKPFNTTKGCTYDGQRRQPVPAPETCTRIYDTTPTSTTSASVYTTRKTSSIQSRTTGKERDAESGNDYFEARYYSSSMGRFMSPDWAAKEEPVPYADLDDPQSLNLYSYVRNNPLSKSDPDGHDGDDVIKTIAVLDAVAPEAAPIITGIGLGVLAGGYIWDHREAIGNALEDAAAKGSMMGQYGDLSKQAPAGSIMASKDSTAAQGENTGPKAATASGVTAGGQATDEHGNKLGPSGKPQVNTTQSNTRKGAQDKAKNEGSGTVEHSNPKVGKPHFHPTNADGEKKPTSTHHEYPEK
jgi:RHS repeat-associated protein